MKKLTTILLLLLAFTACSKKTTKQEMQEDAALEQKTTTQDLVKNTVAAIDSTLLKKNIALKHPSEYKDKLVYTVQIGAFSKPNPRLEADANITTNEEGSLIIYRYGNFDTYQEAKAFKKSAQQLYPDAFIVPINKGKRINITQALKISSETEVH